MTFFADCTGCDPRGLQPARVWAAPVVRTKEAPGPWETKINGHTPRIQMIGDEVTVKVPTRWIPTISWRFT